MSKKKILIIVGLLMVGVFSAIAMFTYGKMFLGVQKPSLALKTDIGVEKVRDAIGSNMDLKKGIVILFTTADECKDFIENHGNDDNVLEIGKGIVPIMAQDEDGNSYYSMSGNAIFEPVFDSLQDGESNKEPIEFGGMFCYVKRIGIQSPDAEALEQSIIDAKKTS